MLVSDQLSVTGLYLPPVFDARPSAAPPHTIISVPLHTAVCNDRADGALFAIVAVQASVMGLYLPPLLKKTLLLFPPQTIISLPVHTAV